MQTELLCIWKSQDMLYELLEERESQKSVILKGFWANTDRIDISPKQTFWVRLHKLSSSKQSNITKQPRDYLNQ